MGVTLNVGSHGILFTTESQLPVGYYVKFSLQWPVEIDNRRGLQLVGTGVVVRSSVNQAAVKILHNEFRMPAIKILRHKFRVAESACAS